MSPRPRRTASARTASGRRMAHRTKERSAAPTSRRAPTRIGSRVSSPDHDRTTADIARLTGKSVDALREAWRERFGSAAPKMQSADILRRLLAWKIQAETFGDLDTETLTELKRARAAIANGKSPVAKSIAS